MLSQDRIAPSEVGERVRRGRQRTAIHDAIERDINPASGASVRTVLRRRERGRGMRQRDHPV